MDGRVEGEEEVRAAVMLRDSTIDRLRSVGAVWVAQLITLCCNGHDMLSRK